MSKVNEILEELHVQRSTEVFEGHKITEDGMDVVYEALIGEASEAPKFDEVSDFKVYKKDDETACVVFGYDGKYFIQGTEDGKDVNLEVGDKDSLDACVKYLKDNGFEEKSVTKEDIQKQFEKLSEGFIQESLILEKPGDRKSFSKHEKGSQRIGYGSNSKAASLSYKAGIKMATAGLSGAITKAVAGKSVLGGLAVASGKGLLGKAVAVKVCTAIPMAGFGGLALAGVGVAAGAAIAHKVVKKNIEKAKSNVNKGYKTAWGKYYKADGQEWVQITKDEYYKLKEKDEPKESI